MIEGTVTKAYRTATQPRLIASHDSPTIDIEIQLYGVNAAMKIAMFGLAGSMFLSASMDAHANSDEFDYGDEFGTHVSVSIADQSAARITGQSGNFEMRSTTFSVEHVVELDDNDALTFTAGAQQIDIETNALIPGTAARVPDELKGASIAVGWIHDFDNDMSLWVEGSAGSLSDKPFRGSESVSYTLSGIVSVPSGNYNAWLLGLDYSNDADDEVLPIIAYEWNVSETLSATVGFPILEVYWQPTDQFEVYAGAGGDGAEIEGLFHLNRRTSLFASYGLDGWSARRFGRSDKKALLNYEQKVLEVGAIYNVHAFDITFSIGRTDDGKLSENRDNNTNRNRLNIEGSDFIRLSVSTAF